MNTSIINALNRLALYLDRSKGYAQAAATELVLHFANPEQLARYTGEAYNRNPHYLDRKNTGLYVWEEAVVAEFFPAAPAKILIGACGGGREMSGLAQLGYAVAGFDPAPALVALTRAVVATDRLLALDTASYQDLLGSKSALLAHAPYDAVILGWGSLSHLGEANTRHDLLVKLRSICPVGPLVLSWVRDAPGTTELEIRSLLGSLGLATRDEREGYTTVGGYSRSYSHEEIFTLAAQTGHRVLRYDEGDYPHALLAPVAR